MAKSTNKSIADHEQTKSHHAIDEERHREAKTRGQEPDQRGRRVEREVARRAKK
jgi:hypothetical protein